MYPTPHLRHRSGLAANAYTPCCTEYIWCRPVFYPISSPADRSKGPPNGHGRILVVRQSTYFWSSLLTFITAAYAAIALPLVSEADRWVPRYTTTESNPEAATGSHEHLGLTYPHGRSHSLGP